MFILYKNMTVKIKEYHFDYFMQVINSEIILLMHFCHTLSTNSISIERFFLFQMNSLQMSKSNVTAFVQIGLRMNILHQ